MKCRRPFDIIFTTLINILFVLRNFIELPVLLGLEPMLVLDAIEDMLSERLDNRSAIIKELLFILDHFVIQISSIDIPIVFYRIHCSKY